MVSLDARNKFIDDLKRSESSCYALALVLREECSSAIPQTIADRAAFAISSHDGSAFARVVEELENRKMNPNADWVLDDFLLFSLLIGKKEFGYGEQLCKSIIGERRPTNSLDIAFNDAMRSLSAEAYAVEGAFSFAKLVFCDLTGQNRLNTTVARIVYTELTQNIIIDELGTFPRLLAYRAFDLLVCEGIEAELGSVRAVVEAIQEMSEKMSIGDWGRIVLAMRPTVITWIVGGLITMLSLAYYAGGYFAPTNPPNGPHNVNVQDEDP